ncbi:MAG: hypothetical protein IKJ43_01420 [Bacilli bacterium]|nr:hypothetical protein [Bacilli bacterium]
MTKKELKRCSSMSMNHFLRTYYGLSDDLAEKLSMHSHKSLREVAKLYEIPLKKIGFQDVTREMIAVGDVLLIMDHFGNPAPYVNPYAILEDEYETTMDERYISYEVYDLNEGEDDYDKYQGRQKVKHFKP